MILRNYRSSIKQSNILDKEVLLEKYGLDSFDFKVKNDEGIFVCSKSRELDLIELDQLLQTVGWSRRPMRRVKIAL